ncbi:Necrosis inducing-like protein NPP1 type [Phytophthora palmivora]|uniref:Necrosis inducing-like protein NPP1 type n=1 Tax=Phytophthora palmivora TaxID=4796 RepID=A0A2P4WWW1_9STRA|nr:Necrosis inducing-like protein NPP1 type [Phytophthora palmivora]
MTKLLCLALFSASLVASAQAEALAYDSVVPLPETEASTIEYSLALKFKPQLNIQSGCHPYPAVDEDGNTNAGLSIFSFKKCDVASLGSQIYGRATTYEDYYAIMYAWYFPRDRKGIVGHRHGWEHAILWLKRMSADTAKLTAVSSSISDNDYFTIIPPTTAMVDGTSVKFQYRAQTFSHYVNITTAVGDVQDLVMWEDMPAAARTALNLNDFGKATVPFKTDTFLENLKDAYPW